MSFPLSVKKDEKAAIIDEVSMALTYLGYPVYGADLSNNPTCAICRITTSGNVTKTEWASGNTYKDKAWDNRASLNYKSLV